MDVNMKAETSEAPSHPVKVTGMVGIQPCQMDVYESAELPEDDQHAHITLSDAYQSDCVEPVGVSINEAFLQFKGKTLEVTGVDFSDDISRIHCSGYGVSSAGPELGQPVVEESLEQKCHRVQKELRELAKEVDLIKVNSGADGAGLSLVELVNQTEYLKRQVVDLTTENQLGISNLSDPQEALQKRLLTELNGFQRPASKSLATPKSVSLTPSDSDRVNYQLFFRPEQAKFCNNARVADFEQRIERLEAVLGQNPEKLSLLTAELSDKTLTSALGLLLAKMKVLDPCQLDLLEPRLVSVYHKVSRTADKKEAVDQTDRLNRVLELLDLAKKVEKITGSYPTIVDRMSALSTLHEQALRLSETLVSLDLAQRQISDQLTAETSMLKQFRELLAETSSPSVELNSRSLNERLTAVTKK